MKHQSLDEMQAKAMPVTNELRPEIRRLRLLDILTTQFAETRFPMGHRLEYMPSDVRAMYRAHGSIFETASKDPILNAGGLTGDTVGDFQRFFGMTDQQLHSVSCDCLGSADGKEIAERLKHYGFNR